MAKKKQRSSSSSVNNNKQIRQQSDQSSDQSEQTAKRRGRKRASSPRRSPWLLVGGILAVTAAIIGFFVYLSNSNANNQASTPVNVAMLKKVTNVDPGLLSQIGTGEVPNPFKVTQNTAPILMGPTGKPEVFYFGAEFCPLCAAERWGIVVAMSRFGTFHGLKQTTSAGNDTYPNTSTFTFYQSSYTSNYVDFVSLENEDRQHNVLQAPTSDEQQLLTRYKINGYPFMDIGDHYLLESASFDPGVLRTDPQDPNSQPMSQQDIANQLSADNSISNNILGTANYLTAAICSITKNQPSSVCGDPAIQRIETILSQSKQSSVPSGNSPLVAAAGHPVQDVWRRQGLF